MQLLPLTATDFAAIAPLVSDLANDGLQLSDMRMSLTPETLRPETLRPETLRNV